MKTIILESNKLFELNQSLKNNIAKEFLIDPKKEWLFMPMNYGWAFSSDKTIKAKILKEAWEYSQKCLNEFIKFINEKEIIIRPHPGVSIEEYNKKFKEIIGKVPKNIFILKNYTIREWIIVSDIIGSSWSTSAQKSFSFFPL